MSAQTQKEAEISHVLELLVELNREFANRAEEDMDIYTIVLEQIVPSEFTGTQTEIETKQDVYNKIKTLVLQNEETYRNITFVNHSFNVTTVNSQHVAAAFFQDIKGNVYFAARGTGNGRWVDNATLMYEEASQMQQATCAYFDYVIQNSYENGTLIKGDLILSGHSKGGNDAQYVTLFSKYRDLIDLCFSFDGPSFSKEAFEKFKKDLKEECEQLGIDHIDPNEYIEKIYGIVGENDYVFFRGRELMIPEKNVFFISTPDGKTVMDFHFAHFMSGGDGLNWQKDENGNIINGSPKALGELSMLIQQLEITMPDDVYKATALSIMSILEGTIGGGRGTGDIEFADPEHFKLFLKEGLPHILNGTTEMPGLKDRPELMAGILDTLGIDRGNLSFEQVGIILNALTNVVNNVDSEILFQALENALYNDGKIDFSKIDWGILIKSLPPKQVLEIFTEYLPQLLKSAAWGLIAPIGEFFNDLFTSVGHELLKIVDQIKIWTADFLSSLDNLIKQGVEFVRESAAEFFAMVNSAIDNAVSLLSNMANGVANFVSGAVSAIGDGVSSVANGITAVAQNVFHELNSIVENTVNVVINAFNDARDTVSEIASNIWRDLSTAVSEVLFGRKITWKEALDNMIGKLEAFVNGFEAKMPSLIKVSIREVNNKFLDFAVNVKSLSKNSSIALKHRAGFVNVGSSTNISNAYNVVNNGKIAVNLSELRKLKGFAEDLLREIESRVKITTKARTMANDSIRQYTQSYVRSDGNAVIDACSKLETDTGRARDELNDIIKGVTVTIDGYTKLEREFS